MPVESSRAPRVTVRAEAALSAAHIEAVLDERTMAVQLDRAGKKKHEVAQEWTLGYKLFQDKGHCAVCHRGPLFTDQDYHNISIGDSFRLELGRIRHAPIVEMGRASARRYADQRVRAPATTTAVAASCCAATWRAACAVVSGRVRLEGSPI